MWGTVPDWVAALATVATVIAIVYARKTLLMEQEKRDHELDTEAKHQASQVSTWVAVVNPEAGTGLKRYGVVLQNSSGAIVHDVEVEVKLFGESVPSPASAFVLPPGTYFIERDTRAGSAYDWGFIRSMDEFAGDVIRPYVNTPKHRVLKTTYGDSLRQRWEQDECGRLQPARGETAVEAARQSGAVGPA